MYRYKKNRFFSFFDQTHTHTKMSIDLTRLDEESLAEERENIENKLNDHHQRVEERDEEHRIRTEGLKELERDHQKRRRSSMIEAGEESSMDQRSLEHEKRALLKLKRDMFMERSKILAEDAKRQNELEDQLERVKAAMKKILNKAQKSSRDLELEKERARDVEKELKQRHDMKVNEIRSKHEEEMRKMEKELRAEMERSKRDLMDHEKRALKKAKEHEMLVLKNAFEHEKQTVYKLKSEMDERIANALKQQHKESDKELMEKSLLFLGDNKKHGRKMERLERIVETHRELLRQSVARLEAFRKILSV